ncbi:MAG: hypothetical protein A4E57_04809 [Syntrophorhabdaceae bacterium PtaU1.Bin034]|nr:MAG: hypothetical protein A4E57_04809 [Syntrophorhabdaceae bacterium PtaU1.Bin034]
MKQHEQLFSHIRVHLFPVRGKPAVLDAHAFHSHKHLGHRHPVEGHRPRLVEAYGLDRAERFDRFQPPDEHVMLSHGPYAEGQGCGGHCRQAFGNGCDGEGNGGLQHAKESVPAQKADQEHCAADGSAHQGKPCPHLLKLTLHGCLRGKGLPHEDLDPAYLGKRTGSNDDGQALAPGHQRSHVHHVGPVGQGQINSRQDIRRLVYRHALARERRLVHREVLGAHQPCVRSHVASGPEHEKVAGHHVVCAHLHHPARPLHEGRGPHQAFQRPDRLFGPALCYIADSGIDADHGEHHRGICQSARKRRDAGSHSEEEHGQTLELIDDDRPCRTGHRFRKHVRPEAAEVFLVGTL